MSIQQQTDEMRSLTNSYIKKLDVQYSIHSQWLSEFTKKSKKELSKTSLFEQLMTPSSKDKQTTRSSTTRIKSRRDSKKKRQKDVVDTPSSSYNLSTPQETPDSKHVTEKMYIDEEEEEIERIRELEREEEIERLRYEMERRRIEQEEEELQEQMRLEEERKYEEFLARETERKTRERLEFEKKEEERKQMELLRIQEERRQEEHRLRRIEEERQLKELQERRRLYLLEKERRRIQEEKEKEERRRIQEEMERERIQEERRRIQEEKEEEERQERFRQEEILKKNQMERENLKKLGTPMIYPDLPMTEPEEEEEEDGFTSNNVHTWNLDNSFNERESKNYLTPNGTVKSSIQKQMDRIKSKSPYNSIMNELKSEMKTPKKETTPTFLNGEVQKYLQSEIPDIKDIYPDSRYSTTSTIVSISTNGSPDSHHSRDSSSPKMQSSKPKLKVLEQAEREKLKEEKRQLEKAEKRKEIEQRKKEAKEKKLKEEMDKKLKEEQEKKIEKELEKKRQLHMRDQLNQLKQSSTTSTLNTSNLSTNSNKSTTSVLKPSNSVNATQSKTLLKMKPPKEESSYKLSDTSYKSESEDEDEEAKRRAKKKIPNWAQGKRLNDLVERTRQIDPNLIFDDFTNLNIKDIWKYETGVSFRPRSSSGNWTKDHFTLKEEEDYKKKMGY
jgi:hypothetical protein